MMMNTMTSGTRTEPNMAKPAFRYITILALPLVVAACGGRDAKSEETDAQPAAVVLAPMDLATAEQRAIGMGITVSGNLDPADVVAVKAQIPGTVSQVRVDRGTPVRRGSVLAVIEAQGIRSQAAGAEAQVIAARAQLSIAQQQLAASKKLYDAGAISAIEYKTAEANVDAAEAQVAVARAAAAGAGESAARATITSPINGVVSGRMVNGGEAVNVGTDLFTVVDASELELDGQVSVQDAARVRVGQPVTFAIDGLAGETLRGRVARVDPTADPGTRQVGVYVRLSNADNRIVGGQFAHGTIETGGTTNAIVIPEAAVTERNGDNAAVFVLNGNKVVKRAVVLGSAAGGTTGLVAVASGVQAGERVLLNPTSDIKDGTAVTVSAGAPAPSSDPAAPAAAKR